MTLRDTREPQRAAEPPGNRRGSASRSHAFFSDTTEDSNAGRTDAGILIQTDSSVDSAIPNEAMFAGDYFFEATGVDQYCFRQEGAGENVCDYSFTS